MPSSSKRKAEVEREERKRAKIASANTVAEKLTNAGLTTAHVAALCADPAVKAKLIEVQPLSAEIAKSGKLPKGWLAAIKPALRALDVPVKAFKRAALNAEMREEMHRLAIAPPKAAESSDSDSSSSDSDSDSGSDSDSSDEEGASVVVKKPKAKAIKSAVTGRVPNVLNPPRKKGVAPSVVAASTLSLNTKGLDEIVLSCRDCQQAFTWSIEGQALYRAKGWKNTPVTCEACRDTAKRKRAAGKMCHAFLKGNCERGAECWFSHAAVSVPGRKIKNASLRPAGVCFAFLRGACTRGDACRFDHSKGKEGEGGAGHFKEAQGVCFAFQKGKCDRGDSCMFSHAVAEDGDGSGYNSGYQTRTRAGDGDGSAWKSGSSWN